MAHLRGYGRNLINWRANAAPAGPATGDLSVTLDPVTLVADATVPVNGDLTKTLADIIISAAGDVINIGDLTTLLEDVALVASATAPAAGDLDKTLAAISILADGQVFNPTVTADLTAVLAITLLAAGTKRFPQPPNNLVSGATRSDFWQTHDFPEIL